VGSWEGRFSKSWSKKRQLSRCLYLSQIGKTSPLEMTYFSILFHHSSIIVCPLCAGRVPLQDGAAGERERRGARRPGDRTRAECASQNAGRLAAVRKVHGARLRQAVQNRFLGELSAHDAPWRSRPVLRSLLCVLLINLLTFPIVALCLLSNLNLALAIVL